jgi:hypothetical protein
MTTSGVRSGPLLTYRADLQLGGSLETAQPRSVNTRQYYGSLNGNTSDRGQGVILADKAACGSSAAAMLLDAFGRFATTEGVDAAVRPPIGAGGSMLAYQAFLRSRGLQADLRFGGSYDDWRRAVESGFGVTVSYAQGSDSHTVRLLAVHDDYVLVQSPSVPANGDSGDGQVRKFTKANFMAAWENLPLLGRRGLETGMGGAYLVSAPDGYKLPAGGSVWAELNAASTLNLHDGFFKLVSGANYLAEGEVVGGAAKLWSGLVTSSLQLPFGVLQAAGAGLELAADRIFALYTNAKGWDKVAAFFLCIVGVLALISGTVLRYAGQWLGAPVAYLARLLCLPTDRLAEWAYNDNQALADVKAAHPVTARGLRQWQQLVATPRAEKIDLIQRLLSGHVTSDELVAAVKVIVADRGTKPATSIMQEPAIKALDLGRYFADSSTASIWTWLNQ